MASTRSKSTETDIEIKDQVTDQELMNDDVRDIEFKELQKKRFRLDRDDNRVIELNTSDMSVVSRAEEIYPRALKFVEEARQTVMEKNGGVDGMDNTTAMEVLNDINEKMKGLINYVFDSDVADKACPSGTLFDPINGKFRFEHILEKLISLYGSDLSRELSLIQQRTAKHTAKYTGKKKR